MIIIGILALVIVVAAMVGPVIVPLIIVGLADGDQLVTLIKWTGILVVSVVGIAVMGAVVFALYHFAPGVLVLGVPLLLLFLALKPFVTKEVTS
jgi:hypothetical protein